MREINWGDAQCRDCGTVRADWQPPCEIDAYGAHHWMIECTSCAGYAHDPGKCEHPGCACETETK